MANPLESQYDQPHLVIDTFSPAHSDSIRSSAIRPHPSDPDNVSSLPDPRPTSEETRVPLTFNIRFASDDSVDDLLNVWVGDRECVRDFKRRIQFLRPALASRRLRLIYLGRVLTDGTLLVPWTELLLRRQNSHLSQPGTVTRALGDAVSGALGAVKGSYDAAIGVKSKGKGKEVEPLVGATSKPETVVWLQCAVGEMLSPTANPEAEQIEDERGPGHRNDSPPPRPLAGFDRLAEAGFSAEDIDQVRRQFHAEHGLISNTSLHDERFQGNTDEDEHARAIEDQWLEGLNSTQDGVESGVGTPIYSTLFKGLCVGFFFPILPLFFFRTDVMDRRTQLAILSGTAINFLFGVLQYTNS
ncbi:hypothetical protein O181_002186 [Austropuccinia psidii MF-1]|uniref:Ubiquitin-like domain-containing protein n=1 Tax=Austropuccinia psidii MF-1 TaxID=1389203 RepID=A0A9Q3BCI8_9BASI|nr:hypothetical protein [Austropuccinia psidii MF-1]